MMNVLSQIAQGSQSPGWGVLESKAKANALLQSDMQTNQMAQGEDPGVQELATTVTALNAALKAQTPEAAAEIYKQYHPNATAVPDFGKMVFGEEVSIPWSDGSILEGPGPIISSFLSAVDKDPSQAQDPEKMKKNYAYLASKGVSVKPPTVLQQERLYATENGLLPRDQAEGLMPLMKPTASGGSSAGAVGTEIPGDLMMSQEEIDFWGARVLLTGVVPSIGMGKHAADTRIRILKSTAKQALGDEATDDKQTPIDAALEAVGKASDTKAMQGSLNFLDKQLTSMGSFVENLGMQVDRVGELSKDLQTFDARILNVPLRAVRGRIFGSPLQAKYDMFLAEIESEIGKLATGSTASIAELSATAQDRWAKIHDKNLSIKDMLSLLEETKKAANMRYSSVKNQIDKTRVRLRTRDYGTIDNVGTTNDYGELTDDELEDRMGRAK